MEEVELVDLMVVEEEVLVELEEVLEEVLLGCRRVIVVCGLWSLNRIGRGNFEA